MTTTKSRFPTRDGRPLFVSDNAQEGTEIYWSSHQRCWVAVDFDSADLALADRLVAVEGIAGQYEPAIVDDYTGPGSLIACDLDGNGLVFYSLDEGEEYDESQGCGRVVWDSEDE